jgi:hypothetical protein
MVWETPCLRNSGFSNGEDTGRRVCQLSILPHKCFSYHSKSRRSWYSTAKPEAKRLLGNHEDFQMEVEFYGNEKSQVRAHLGTGVMEREERT